MKQHHLLVVDDNPTVRGLSRLELERQGYRVTTAGTVEEAISCLDQSDVSLAILDILMPGMDGLQLMEALKQKHPKLPIIILTGIGFDEEVIKEALSNGAAAYVSKGLSVSHLVMEIRRVLKQSNSGDGASSN
jgi:DNA-binding response OmpR family regulator